MKYRAIQEEVRCLLSSLIAIVACVGLRILIPVALESEQGFDLFKTVIYVITEVIFWVCLVMAVISIGRAIGHIVLIAKEHYESECRHIDYIANNCVLPHYCEKEYNNEDYGIVYYVGKKHSKKCIYALFLTKEQAEERGLLEERPEHLNDSLLNYQARKMDR